VAVLSSTAFAVLLWGTVLAVFLVFVYEVYAIADDAGWIDRIARQPLRSNRGDKP
jgi:hypothetical protein